MSQLNRYVWFSTVSLCASLVSLGARADLEQPSSGYVQQALSVGNSATSNLQQRDAQLSGAAKGNMTYQSATTGIANFTRYADDAKAASAQVTHALAACVAAAQADLAKAQAELAAAQAAASSCESSSSSDDGGSGGHDCSGAQAAVAAAEAAIAQAQANEATCRNELEPKIAALNAVEGAARDAIPGAMKTAGLSGCSEGASGTRCYDGSNVVIYPKSMPGMKVVVPNGDVNRVGKPVPVAASDYLNTMPKAGDMVTGLNAVTKLPAGMSPNSTEFWSTDEVKVARDYSSSEYPLTPYTGSGELGSTVVMKDKVYLMPNSGDTVFILDRASGRQIGTAPKLK